MSPLRDSRFSAAFASPQAAHEPQRIRDVLDIVRQVGEAVARLHAAGQFHRTLDFDHVFPDESGRITLSPPPVIRSFGGLGGSVNDHPPELQSAESIDLPNDIEAARQILATARIDLDPRLIDVYQLGGLLCELLAGSTVESYLRSPRTKSLVPESLQTVLNRTLGYDATERITTVQGFLAALADADGISKERRPPAAADRDTSPSCLADGPLDDTPGGASDQRQEASEGVPIQRLGHFQIVRQLGRGGMGDVYLAYEPELDRTVALKVLAPELARDSSFVRRFRSEAAAVARLNHPNVVQVHFIGEDQGRHFFAMQHVEGPSLAELLAERPRLEPDEVVRLMEQVLAGLAAAHARGLIHRDIKPANILLDRHTGRALLADFGLVKQIQGDGTGTATGVVMGTVDYLAPEQGRGTAVDHRADLYSLGVLMYRMLAGRLPFASDTPTAMIFQHAYEPPSPLSAAAPGTPPRLIEIVERLLEKSPENRFQSAEDVLTALRSYRSGHSGSASPASTAESRPGRARSRVIHAPALEPLPRMPDLPRDEITPAIRSLPGWRRWRGRLLGWWQAHSPATARRWFDTEMQCDAAIVQYEQRHTLLSRLADEAESVLQLLQTEVERNQQAADRAGREAADAARDEIAAVLRAEASELQQTADELATLRGSQEEQLRELRRQQAQVGGRLTQLRGQQVMLAARLKTARAEQAVAARNLPGVAWPPTAPSAIPTAEGGRATPARPACLPDLVSVPPRGERRSRVLVVTTIVLLLSLAVGVPLVRSIFSVPAVSQRVPVGAPSEPPVTADPSLPRFAVSRHALEFAGNGFVTLADTRYLVALDAPFTAEMWVQWVRDGGRQNFMGSYIPSAGGRDARGWRIGWTDMAPGDSRVFLALGCVRQPSFGGAMAARQYDAGWHHVAISHSPARPLRIFVDGMMFPMTLPTPSTEPGTDLVLGAGPYLANRTAPLLGRIRAFRLTRATRYVEDFARPVTYDWERDANTVVLLDFSKPQGSEIADLSGYGHHGRITGAVWGAALP